MDEIIKQASLSLYERAIHADSLSECELLLMSAVRLDASLLEFVPTVLREYQEQALIKKYNERMK